jgi:hypothetical protein
VIGLALWSDVSAAHAQLKLILTPAQPDPQPVGTVLTWRGWLGTLAPQTLYRFEVDGGDGWRLVQDYSKSRTLRWTSLQEGQYQVRLSVLDPGTGSSTTMSATVRFTSRVTGSVPVVATTEHPLVALYSAPPCTSGSVHVRFRPLDDVAWQATPRQACHGAASLNFYVAGMRARTTYVLQQELVDGGTVVSGPQLSLQTGDPALDLPALTMVSPPDADTSASEPMLLTSFVIPAPIRVSQQVGPIATDLAGNILWYDPRMATRGSWASYLVRVVPGGTMLLLMGHQPNYGQVLRESDLAGITVRETNVTALNAQLARMGKDPISYLSHDALRLPNGHTVILAPVERLLTGVQGPGTKDVLGYAILDLDPNFQIVWTWNAFDFLDPHRRAVMNELCAEPACGPLRLASVANDWIHGNSLAHLPDGNLLLSMRHQDWVVKIDYRDGAGTGQVLWRLGDGGDFTIVSDDPWPWFSHQHQVEWAGDRLVLYDNGNTRINRMNGGHSRGQALLLDEARRTATLILNADLGLRSAAWGSAQHLANGNYHFMNGLIPPSQRMSSESVEVLADGGPNYRIMWGSGAYRSFRMKDIYTP